MEVKYEDLVVGQKYNWSHFSGEKKRTVTVVEKDKDGDFGFIFEGKAPYITLENGVCPLCKENVKEFITITTLEK